MFERFTDAARRVIVLAQEEARLLRHTSIGTEHLLLGLVHEGRSGAAAALAGGGVTLERGRELAAEIVAPAERAPRGHIPFSKELRKVLELSLREALRLRQNFIAPPHLLVALLREGSGVGAQILGRIDVDVPVLRAAAIEAAERLVGVPGEGESVRSSLARRRTAPAASGDADRADIDSLLARLDQVQEALVEEARARGAAEAKLEQARAEILELRRLLDSA